MAIPIQLFFVTLGGLCFIAGIAFAFSSLAYFNSTQNLLQETIAVNYSIAAMTAFCCTAVCTLVVHSLTK